MPSIRSSASTAILPGAVVTSAATRRKNRSVGAIATSAVVAHVSVTGVTVVVSGAVPVASQSVAPVAAFSLSVARGYITPAFVVLRTHNTVDAAEPAGMTPERFGLPAAVSKSLIGYTPVGRFLKSTLSEAVGASGPTAFNWRTAPLVLEFSL
jgi:hypothetical protein